MPGACALEGQWAVLARLALAAGIQRPGPDFVCPATEALVAGPHADLALLAAVGMQFAALAHANLLAAAATSTALPILVSVVADVA